MLSSITSLSFSPTKNKCRPIIEKEKQDRMCAVKKLFNFSSYIWVMEFTGQKKSAH